jgi:hypothetical protein
MFSAKQLFVRYSHDGQIEIWMRHVSPLLRRRFRNCPTKPVANVTIADNKKFPFPERSWAMLAHDPLNDLAPVPRERVHIDTLADAIPLNLPPADVQSSTIELKTICAALQTRSLSIAEMKGALSRALELLHTNIPVTHEMIELFLVIAHTAPLPDISSQALNLAARGLFAHRGLAIEIIDSDALAPVFNWLNAPMTRGQLTLFEMLFGTEEVAIIIETKFDFLNTLQNLVVGSTSDRHRHHLLTVLVHFCSALDLESSPLLVPVFERFVAPLIHVADQPLFEIVIQLFTMLLMDREEPALVEFMFSGVHIYLMERFPNCRHFAKEQILSAFLAISRGTMRATRRVFQSFLMQYALDTFPKHEDLQALIIDIASNTLSLGPDILEPLASHGLLDLALGIHSAGRYKSRLSTVRFFSNLCVLVDDPRVEALFIEHGIVATLADFLTVAEKIWADAINGITMVVNHIEGNPFDHPLFGGVDATAFYEVLCRIHDESQRKQCNRGLVANVGNLLELFDQNSDFFVDVL